MVLNVQVALIGAHQARARESALRILGCQTKFGWLMNGCLFPGVDVYLEFQEYYREAISRVEHDLGDNYQIKGWLSEYNIRHGISQNW
ncbi:hypothetical protein OESDEN_07943 [Oesophagostomum dentatum]|uniref:Uncharacterized protein n=1 Tax=Oesophagostomum dentatum TaxID=61180 RepID=A0A0B1TA07_OESDE|nr:hypothetical protein OESDEN_07943 [Oesophagostomum dentatum]